MMGGPIIDQTAAKDTQAVDYRYGSPWDFGLLPAVLRRVSACTKAGVAQHWPALPAL